jgi:hypothetical protein
MSLKIVGLVGTPALNSQHAGMMAGISHMPCALFKQYPNFYLGLLSVKMRDIYRING